MKARKRELNLDPDFDPLDPAQVSDPACWITGESAEALKRGLTEGISLLRYAPILPASERHLDMTTWWKLIRQPENTDSRTIKLE